MLVLEGMGYLAHHENQPIGTFAKILPNDYFRIRPGEIHKVWAKTDLKIVEVSNAVPDTDVIHHEE